MALSYQNYSFAHACALHAVAVGKQTVGCKNGYSTLEGPRTLYNAIRI